MSDREIMELYRSGAEDRAFAELVGSYGERLYWHIRLFTCSHEDTDDLVQEVFIKAWRSLDGFRGDSGLYTWLYRIATNETLNFLRKNRLKASLTPGGLESLLDSKLDEDSYFDGNELQREIQKSINRLPAKQKQVFVMRYFDEMPYEEISKILGTSVGSLKASYHHAAQKVRERLEKIF